MNYFKTLIEHYLVEYNPFPLNFNWDYEIEDDTIIVKYDSDSYSPTWNKYNIALEDLIGYMYKTILKKCINRA